MRRTVARGILAVAVAAGALCLAAVEPRSDWIMVDYGELVDRRELTHSGEPVGVLLALPSDARTRALLDPVLERYAFVLPDAFDAMGRFRPRTELATLWPEGGSEPAWVELLRARRYVVESDGAGQLRAFLPVTGRAGATVSAAAAEAAWREAWPVLRHLLAAERRRRPGPLSAEVYPYVHEPERTRFRVGVTGWRTEVEETEDAGVAPLDLDAWDRFLARGLTLEGARLDPEGGVRLLGDDRGQAPSILSRPLAVSDLAAAWRAVAHGGENEPYMSLDRGDRPWTTRVTYGGRLRDTALGLVSLRCDVRFKTFSLGLSPDGRGDLRGRLRAAVPGFRTHLERFAADPGSRGTWSQQTRLWFYPDDVDLALSTAGDALVVGRARMTAASEREDATREGGMSDPPWTRDTVRAVNRDYALLARTLPELADLDQVVRLLSLATWLHQARAEGLAVPDLDVLLDVVLPAEPTPRVWPQLLAFNALPPTGGTQEVEVVGRGEVGEALDRLQPSSGRLPARRRLARALAALDAKRDDHAALLREAETASPDASDGEIDLLAWRAERLGMHALVLGTLPDPVRPRAGDGRRLFSVGIGGLDLGMERALARAPRRRLELRGAGRGPAARQADRPRSDAAALPVLPGPPSGARFRGAVPRHGGWTAATACPAPFEERGRTVRFDADCRPVAVVRAEGGRRIAHRFDHDGTAWTARAIPAASLDPPAPIEPGEPPPGLGCLAVVPSAGTAEALAVSVRLLGNGHRFEASLPRLGLQRLLLGPRLAPAGTSTLPGLVPVPAELGELTTWMVWTPRLPVEGAPGEEDPTRVAWALRASPLPVVLGIGSQAIERWTSAPSIARGLLVVPSDAFPGALASLRGEVQAAWARGGGGRVPAAEGLTGRKAPDLVVLASAEAPAVLAGRLAALASDPRLAGRHLAVASLGGDLDPGTAAHLLDLGPAGVALSGARPGLEADLVARLGELAGALETVRRGVRAETLPALGTWTYGISGSRAQSAPPAGESGPSPSRWRR